MARSKKIPPQLESLPGLFDDPAEESGLFADPLPVHPAIERAAMRAANRKRGSHGRAERPEIFGDEDFTPLEVKASTEKLFFMSFGSGSSGNAAYLGDGDEGIIIDAGVDSKVILEQLERHGISIKSIKGVLLTHDHSDHVRFVYPLIRKQLHIGLYCTPKILNGMLRRHSISNRIKDYHRPIYKEHPFVIGNFQITAFEVNHDGTDNAGYFIRHGKHKFVVSGDFGSITDRADFYMRQANYLMIESNYDESMLAAGSYPEYLKNRIRSGVGHPDNRLTASYLRKIYSEEMRNVFLCHLSKDNNTPQIAFRVNEQALIDAGATVGDMSNTPYARMASVQLMALPRFEATSLIPLTLK